MSRLIKHVIGWGIVGVIITAEFVVSVVMTNTAVAICIFLGALALAGVIVAAAILISS